MANHPTATTKLSFGFLLFAVFLNTRVNSLQCYSYLTRPDEELICPRGQNNFCVKEIVSTKAEECGGGDYFGDTWKGECVYKKCADTCVEGRKTFIQFGRDEHRTTYCCNNEDWCNGGVTASPQLLLIAVLVMAMVAVGLY